MTTSAPNTQASTTAPPVPSVQSVTPKMGRNFAFHYEGPIAARQTPGCNTCIAAIGMQPPHVCMPGCAICSAGRTKVCPSHQGVDVALEDATVPDAMEALFESSKTVVKAALVGATGPSNVRIKIFGQSGMVDAPPRTVTVEITLLNEAPV